VPKTAAFVKLVAHPGGREELLAVLRPVVDAIAAEEGTEVYSLHLDRGDDNAVWLFELYRDDDALAEHTSTVAMKELLAALPGLLERPPEMSFTTPVAAAGLDIGAEPS
jgi:quinol monooxygenase YgiN